MNSQSPAQWISAREAALLTGASIRAIQKRAARGSIEARKVEVDGVEVWEIDAHDLGASKGTKVDASKGANGAPISAKVDAPKTPIDVQIVANVGAPNSVKMDAPKVESGRVQNDMTARLLAQLETENSFLRSTIEQLQRDSAEVRAALREALKQRPKALPEAAPDAETDRDSQPAPKGSETGSIKPEKPLTYNDIADELERQLKEVDL